MKPSNNKVESIDRTSKNKQVARDLMEDGRCGRSHDIANSFDQKVSDTDPFWKDRTFLELNFAVSGTVGCTVVVVYWGTPRLEDRFERQYVAGQESVL